VFVISIAHVDDVSSQLKEGIVQLEASIVVDNNKITTFFLIIV